MCVPLQQVDEKVVTSGGGDRGKQTAAIKALALLSRWE